MNSKGRRGDPIQRVGMTKEVGLWRVSERVQIEAEEKRRRGTEKGNGA